MRAQPSSSVRWISFRYLRGSFVNLPKKVAENQCFLNFSQIALSPQ